MPHPQFASFRATPPAPTYAVNSGGATTTSRTLYFRWQYQNRYGLNLGAISGPFAIASGQKLDIAIPESARLAGEDIHYFVLSASTSNDPTTFRQLAFYKGYEVDQVTPSMLPFTLTLNRDEHFAIAQTIANEAALPTGVNLIPGMIRFITSLSKFFYYDPESSATVGVDVLAAATGRWLRIGGWDTYVANTTDSDGCDRDLRLLDATTIRVPLYDLSGPGTPVRYLLFNSRSEDGGTVPQSTPINIAVFVNGRDRSQFFSGYLKVVFEGYYRASTGVLDTSLDGAGITQAYQYEAGNLALPTDLPNGYAYAFKIYPEAPAYVLNDLVPQDATVGLQFSFLGQSGDFNPAGQLTGDFIAAEYNLRRIVPGTGLTAKALSGSGTIALSSFRNAPQATIAGFAANTANQKVAIDGNGTVAVVSAIATGQAQRALVGTVDGVGQATAFASSTVTLNPTALLKVTVTYPTAIRADYPDAIANSTAGEFNATKVRFYVQPAGGGTITQFDAAIAPGASQEFLVGAVSGTSTGSSLPTVAANFGLYAPEDDDFVAAAQAGSSVFSAGSYVVAIAYYYEGTITSISHAQSDGNIPEAVFTLAELQEAAKAVGPAVADIAALRAIASANRPPYQSRFVVTQGNPYRFYPDELTADNGTNIIKPDDLSALDPGRWVLDDASQILHGAGNPSNTLGENGDYYYDVDDDALPTFGNLHYKSSGVWTLLANVIGPKGDRGFSFLLLDHNPLVSEGADGDTAFNYTSRDLYEKVSGTWTLRQNLKDIDFRGNWNGGTQYEKDDAVLHNRDLWRSLRTNTGVTPTEGADWTLLLPGGQDGADGQSLELVGIYDNTATYSYLNQIRYEPGTADDGSYVYINATPSSGNAPPNPTYWQKVASDGLDGADGVDGTDGIDGVDGSNAYSNLTAGFTQPAVNSNVVAAIANTGWIAVNGNVFVASAGYYQVVSVNSPTSATLKNLGYSTNAAPGSAIASGSLVTPTGDRGATGATGAVSAASAVILQHQSTDPTTGADESALYVKVDGKAYLRAENDGAISEIGSGAGGGGSVDIRNIWLFG